MFMNDKIHCNKKNSLWFNSIRFGCEKTSRGYRLLNTDEDKNGLNFSIVYHYQM